MSEKLKEAVSAAIDDEADEFELRRVLDEVHKDKTLKAAWDRYLLVGAMLRKEHSAVADGLRDAVWAELEMVAAETEPAAVAQELANPEPHRGGSRLNRVTGFAVAASVALAVALIGVNLLDDTAAPDAVRVADTSAPQTLPVSSQARLSRPVTDQDQARTAALMLHHTQQLGMNQPGPAAFTKLVTYQSR